ncbi:ferritin-like domain-containing protein [Streptomyces sp. HNM0574]|uniref:ferritin-like domain-containing protein n=1 Tax=Streptomyces sp. HNM0574 TaxID=2714954 RepID=UPI00146AC63A|nr:ferritin-like domain-containing protein [Streptomyces sp. HNM0574]NLU66198.1 ferritin-like domain-containing protein [Streptomyces sp. HNM0574]
MLSAKSLFQEIFDNDASFRLFCSIAASGEAQGGWENGRIAALLPESKRHLAAKVVRHGADEDKHGRIFQGLLKKRGMETAEVPEDTDYTMLLEGLGIGLAHEKLRGDEPLTEYDVLTYLVHSRVTEQRASEEMVLLRKHFGDDPGIGRAVRIISQDEDNHLAYCHEELLRLAREGHGREIHRLLRESALAEIRVYRDVSLGVMSRMGQLLGWSRPKAAALAAGIHARYVYERLGGWRRMVSLTMPERRDALGTDAASGAGAARAEPHAA